MTRAARLGVAAVVLFGCTRAVPFQHLAVTSPSRPDGRLVVQRTVSRTIATATAASSAVMIHPTSTTTGLPKPAGVEKPLIKQPPMSHSPWAALLASCPWDQRTAQYVMQRESGGNPNAVDPIPVWLNGRWVHAAGLMQLLGGSLNPYLNIAQACALWRARGWEPWSL